MKLYILVIWYPPIAFGTYFFIRVGFPLFIWLLIFIILVFTLVAGNFMGNSDIDFILQYIEVNPKVLNGKPVVRYTRISIELILEKLASGETFEEILIAHPHITEKAIRAALMYASLVIRSTI